jgi:hypothetical protein
MKIFTAAAIFLGLLLLSQHAMAQGCAAQTRMDLPPCCSVTNMSAGGTCVGPASRYVITFNIIGLETADGGVISMGQSQLFDAASVNAGEVMGNFLSGAAPPNGTYTALRADFNRSIDMAANVTTADNRTCSGTSNADFSQGSNPIPNCAAGQPNAQVFSCFSGGSMLVRDDSLGALTFDGKSATTIRFEFSTENGALCTFSPGSDPGTVSTGALDVRMFRQ